MRSDRLARRSSFFRAEDRNRVCLRRHRFRSMPSLHAWGSSGPWKCSGKMRACVVAVAVLWPRKVRIDFTNRACVSILMGPLSFAGLGGRWACAMTDESAVYFAYAKGIFHI